MSAYSWGLLLGFCGLVASVYLFKKTLIRKKRQKLYDKDFPQEWVKILTENMPMYRKLPNPIQSQLHGHINIFLAEKNFVGYHGIEVNDEMKVLIAANACILLLNRKTNYYPYLHNVLIYPEEFRHHSDDSVKHSRAGESWLRGPLVLSWAHSYRGLIDARDGHNVILHEFAHQLDQENGAADGLPILRHNKLLSWSRVLNKEYEKLIQIYERGRKAFIDEYGTTNPAEFFAVITEHFFEQGKLMKKKHPELYQELSKYYQVDPQSWKENHE